MKLLCTAVNQLQLSCTTDCAEAVAGALAEAIDVRARGVGCPSLRACVRV